MAFKEWTKSGQWKILQIGFQEFKMLKVIEQGTDFFFRIKGGVGVIIIFAGDRGVGADIEEPLFIEAMNSADIVHMS